MSDIYLSGVTTVVPSQTSVPPTTLDWIEETKRYLYTGARDQRNKLNGALSDSAETLTLDFASPLPETGDRIAVGLEVMHVWSRSGQVVTVERGMEGSTAASHPDDSLVSLNPVVSDYGVFRALNNDLRDLSGLGLFRMKALDLTWSATTVGYDFPADELLEVYEVRIHDTGPFDSWPTLEGWELARSMNTGEFASGQALMLPLGIAGRTVRVLYKAPFTLLSGLSDDAATVSGLPATALDLPPLGAAIRLTAGREVKRNFDEAQGQTRRAEEVPAAANLRANLGLIDLRNRRIAAERANLGRQWPVRRRRAVPCL